MSQPVQFTPVARLEFIDAFDWYEARAPGLGAAFQNETDRQVARITENPTQFPIVMADVRRVRLRRFPYSLFYRITDPEVFVIACFHASRNPRIWQGRT